ncbi:hypothetical protein STH316 [Symbiobacterium thermophilum IAM 14863]|nr:hypothetical protein STH316 [Symbiobacterium thermophilum IAM 14863]
MLLTFFLFYPLHIDVSILTRPRGRVLPVNCAKEIAMVEKFQSSPGLAAGCYMSWRSNRFSSWGFQSSPGLAAGCYRTVTINRAATVVFQSSPGLAAGCYTRPGGGRKHHPPAGFNPHPASRPGATWPKFASWPATSSFQSSPGLAAGCYRQKTDAEYSADLFQSSPGLAAGCYPYPRGGRFLSQVSVLVLRTALQRPFRQYPTVTGETRNPLPTWPWRHLRTPRVFVSITGSHLENERPFKVDRTENTELLYVLFLGFHQAVDAQAVFRLVNLVQEVPDQFLVLGFM